MLGKLSPIRHGLVAAAVAGTTILAAAGVIAGGTHPERFDAKTVVIERVGDHRIRVTEYVDIDFGTNQRHGYERVIPNDLGAVVEVEASSPDANADVDVLNLTSATRIRLGDPNKTISGQHRYVLAYSYPNVHIADGEFNLDLIAPGDQETLRFEAIVVGFELADPTCNVGANTTTGGCTLERLPGDKAIYQMMLEPLKNGDGLTLTGEITDLVDTVSVPTPEIPQRREPHNRGLAAAAMVGLGGLATVPVYRWARRSGRNEVFGGGAADAAYGDLPTPGSATAASTMPVTLVADADMSNLATTEFVPPKGLAPWEAAVLLTEQLRSSAVEAWISGMAAAEALELKEVGKKLQISSGPKRNELPPEDAVLVNGILSIGDPYTTGEYDEEFASAWTAISKSQKRRIAESGWWKQSPPGSSVLRSIKWKSRNFRMILGVTLIWGASLFGSWFGSLRAWPAAIGFGLVGPAIVAFLAYQVLLPARSAEGSALALRAESFRRFLHLSEGPQVEWAWSQGLLRQYSAWAVALGEADAWSAALSDANVDAPAQMAAGPLFVHSSSSSMRSSRVAPSSSSSGGGGGVGGGGGGGGSGSW